MCVVVDGGVHGYETSGVWGALLFIERHLAEFSEDVNVLVLPCISPWGYECIERWNPEAIDPNRCFVPEKPGCPEAEAAMECIAKHVKNSAGILMHVDCHETTNSDLTRFRPAKYARDGTTDAKFSAVPPGFYLVSGSHAPEPEWQKALIDAVEKVTKIAPAEEDGTLIGEEVSQRGVVTIPGRTWGICGAHTEARFATTTEVYPDAEGVTDEECNEAQCACAVAGVKTALAMSA